MKAQRIVIYGAGVLGHQVLYHIQQYCMPNVQLLGFVDDTRPAGSTVTNEYSTLGGIANFCQENSWDPNDIQVVFAIGHGDMGARAAALNRVRDADLQLYSVVHPTAVIEQNAKVGSGAIVLAGAIIDQDVRLGEGCFIDVAVRLGDGTCAGENNYISAGTSTGSRVNIGSDNFFGMDVTITTDVQIGSNVFVNAKTLVPRDVKDNLKIVEMHKLREIAQRNELSQQQRSGDNGNK